MTNIPGNPKRGYRRKPATAPIPIRKKFSTAAITAPPNIPQRKGNRGERAPRDK